jgi:hypothetical protein
MVADRRLLVILLTLLGIAFFVIAAAISGGMFTMTGGDWFLPGGLAAWCLAWLLSFL